MIKILILFIVAFVGVSVADLVEDYYWQDYHGTIPKEALAVNDNVGRNVYIAQGLTKDGRILLGSLNNSSTTVLAYDIKLNLPTELSTNIKVFCTNKPDNFTWASTGTNRKLTAQITRVYGGVIKSNDRYPFGSLAISRVWISPQYAVGYHDVTLDGQMYYVLDNAAYSRTDFEELFYIGN